jgi:RHS repeat-associated protein
LVPHPPEDIMPTLSASLRKAAIVVALVLLASFPCWAQITTQSDATETPIAGAGHDYIGMLNDTVSPEIGTVSLQIKVPVPPGRKLTLPFSFQYSSGGALFLASNWQLGWGAKWTSTTAPLVAGGWSYTLPQAGRVWKTYTIPPQPPSPDSSTTCGTTLGYVFTDANGTQHNLYMSHVYSNYPTTYDGSTHPVNYACQMSGFTSNETDTGGDSIVRSVLPSPTSGQDYLAPSDGGPNIADPDGTVYFFGTGLTPQASSNSDTEPLARLQDRNGNRLSITYTSYPQGNPQSGQTSGFTVTDTIGRSAVSASSFGQGKSTVTVSGLSESYTATWSTVNYSGYTINTLPEGLSPTSTCAGSSGSFPGQAGSESVITSLTLPNGQAYQFTYDQVHGTLAKILYPSGGYVSYTWGINPLSTTLTTTDANLYNQCFMYIDTAAVLHRYVSFDGSTTALQQDFLYSTTPNGGAGWSSKQTTVTTHDLVRGTSFETVYTYSPLNINCGPNGGGGNCSQLGVETTIQYYDTSDALLETVTKGWYDQNELACELHTLNNGLISGVFYTYGPGGQVTDKKEYDYGQITSTSVCPAIVGTPNAPSGVTRETVTTYQSFPATSIFTSAPSILDRPSSVKVYAGSSSSGTLMAETDYTYDGGTPTVGNATKIVKRCLQAAPACSSGDSPATYAYDSNGQVTSVTDARNYPTQFSYVDSYSSCGGNPPPISPSDAYLTTITYPTTNNGVPHVVKFCYGYDDGQLRGATDENSQPTIYKYNDSLGRLTETDYPDVGKTTLSYNDAPPNPTVTTTKVMNSSQSIVNVAEMDGMGHAINSMLTSDPQGTIYTPTVYDGLGRVYKAYNPYRSTSDSTYGFTTSVYDALGRTTQVTKTDNSVVTTQYSGNQTTVTDEAGNQRRSFTDGLGRLVEVDEPGGAPGTAGTGSVTASGSEQSIPGTGATAGTGSVTFSGTLQCKSETVPGTPGTGSVTISGAEQSKQVTQAATNATGTISFTGITSNTQTVTVGTYTANLSVPTSEGTNVLAQAAASGLNGSGLVTASYSGSTVSLTSIVAGTAGNYSISVSGASASIQGMSGGTNGSTTTIYDQGTITITVNSHSDTSPPWGTSSTASSIASSLASTINADTAAYVTAITSGATVYLTAKTTGTATNYSLSCSDTYDSKDFSSSSFTCTPSGPTLTGGTNPGSKTVCDSGIATITANLHGDSYSWSGSGTTASSIASSTASAINADTAAYVTATVSGATVYLTAKTTGTATNYSLSCSCTYDSTDFSSPSFTCTPSGSTLTGGSNGNPWIYDTGSVWVTVNGTQATASYGQGDTSATVAFRLQSAMGSLPVNVSLSGSTLNLTAKSTGTASDYSLSAGSSTSQPGSFSHPSFTMSVSGSTLTGGSNAAFSLSTPSVTLYTYDALDDLTCAVQKATDTTTFTNCASASHTWRPRSFTYDSLKRLTNSQNPEAGNVSYTYDANGNVVTKTDGRGIITNYSPASSPIDALNRVTMVTYSDGTPTASYTYDQSACLGQSSCYNIGHRTTMTDAGGTEYFAYEKMGRMVAEQRTTNGQTKTTTYSYNLAGEMTALKYPSSRTITYTYDSAGRPSLAQDLANGINYALGACANGVGSNGVCYAPPGVSQIQNGANLVSTYLYNTRFQPCWMYATTGTALPTNTSCTASDPGPGNILDLQYNFNLGHDNSNVMGITNNRTASRTQTFTYDPLNRIVTAQTPSWSQAFSYDAWANLFSTAATGTAPLLSLTVGVNNQLTTAGFKYDAAGNELTDGTKSYAWNAESEITTADGVNYTYDGDGNRLMKSSGKIYWYGAGTEILDESDTSGNVTSEYMFFSGKRIARRDISSGNIYYYEEDTLGSSRSIVQAGQTSPCYDADFYPFGGELIVTNTCPQNYKFEGKERDTETNNDDFGARYYSSVYGRWLSADWSAVPAPVPYANLANPQTLNLYAMVSDNPETFADLDGHAAQAPLQWIFGCNEDLGGCPDQNPPPLSTTQQNVTAASAITSSTQQQTNTPQVGTTGPQQAQETPPPTTLNLGGTKVDVTLSAAETELGGKGAVIEANPQDCGDCRWAQTVTRTGTAPLATQTDRQAQFGAQPLYPPTEPMNQFWDFPSTHKGGSATLTAVTTLGVADANSKTFKVLGSMTWGYKVDKSGNITTMGPRVATRAEQARSIAVLKRDSPTWTIVGP